MKYVLKSTPALLLCMALLISPKRSPAQQISVSFQVFYDQLGSYGQWVDYPEYGYVWVPPVDAGFVPYETAGHWIFTDYGWTWVSDYDWGWAAFHYGRWYYDDYLGWVWVPDTQWGPAWVVWREAPDYFGWAPMSPGISFSINISDYDIPPQRWVFVPAADIMEPQVAHYAVARTENVTVIKKTTIIKNVYVDKSRNVTYMAGPERTRVETVVKKRLQPVKIEESSRPEQKVSGDKLVIFKPQVQKTAPNGNKPTPPKAVPLQEARKRVPPQQNNAGNSPGQQQQRSSNPALNNREKEQPQRTDQDKNTNPANNNRTEQPQQERKPQNEQPPVNKPEQQRQEQPKNNPPANNRPGQEQEKKPQPEQSPGKATPDKQQQQEKKPQSDKPPANNKPPGEQKHDNPTQPNSSGQERQQEGKKPQKDQPPANDNNKPGQQKQSQPLQKPAQKPAPQKPANKPPQKDTTHHP